MSFLAARAQKNVIRSKPRSVPKTFFTESEYWEKYYDHPDVVYEWNNGLLEEKPVSDYVNFLMWRWFTSLLEQFLVSRPIAKMTGLEMGFRLALPNKTTIRRPDLGVVCNNNPVSLEGDDRTYRGVCDMCIEALSDSTKGEKERDTVTKKQEYAASGVKEYYILHDSDAMAFYRLNAQGMYVPIKPVDQGIIKSKVLPGFQFRIADLYQKPSLEEMSEDKVYQGFILPFYQEEKKAREMGEKALEMEKKAREKAEAKIKRLEAEMARFRKKSQ